MPRPDSFILSPQKHKAILYGHKKRLSVRTIALTLDISMTTVRKYLKKNGLKPPDITEAMRNRKLDKQNGFSRLAQFKEFINRVLMIEPVNKFEPVSYCMFCGYKSHIEDTGLKCPKCRFSKLVSYNVINNLVAEWSIY